MSIASLCRAARSLGINAAEVVENVRAFERQMREMPPIKSPIVYHYRCSCCGCPAHRWSTDPIAPGSVFCPICGGKCVQI